MGNTERQRENKVERWARWREGVTEREREKMGLRGGQDRKSNTERKKENGVERWAR